MRFRNVTILVASALAAFVGRSWAAPQEEPPKLEHCLVSLIEEALVPAQEAGVILNIKAKEGQAVSRGDVLAQVENAIPQAEKRKAIAERAAAKEKADSDIDIRYATAASEVAYYEYLKNKEAYDKIKNSVPFVEVKRLELAWKRAVLQIEQSQVEQRVNAFTAETKAAEVDAAEEGIKHRQIKSPLDGIVVEVVPHQGEWVKPGDKVMHIVRMDRLRVEGSVDSSKYSPQEVRDRNVTVTVALAHHPEPVQFTGKIAFVNPLVEQEGKYRVWAEVDNRLVPGRSNEWLLWPGVEVTMTIDTK